MALDLTVLEPGHALGRSGACLEVRREGTVLQSVPVHRLASVTLGPGVSLSTDLMAALADRGVPLLVQDGAERPAAALLSPHLGGAARLRRAQALATASGAALGVARALVRTKILHQGRLQQLWARYGSDPARESQLHRLGEELLALAPESDRMEGPAALMALEGEAARLHWRGVALMVPFTERRYPRAPDLTNQLLNYGYGVLTRHWFNAALRAGLDPHLGVLHADRLGRPSLVLDLLEPWRPWVDRTVVGLIRQGIRFAAEQGELTLDSRRRLLEALHRAFRATPPRHRHALSSLWLANTRQLARHLVQGDPWHPLALHP